MPESYGGAIWQGRRSYHENAYHYCARCGSRVFIADLEWQFGLLVCKTFDCIDHGGMGLPLIGQREAYIAHVLENLPNERELMPDQKLTEPSLFGPDNELEILY